MNLNAIKIGGQSVGRIVYRNTPTILTWLGISGFITTIGMAIKATPEAMRILERERDQREKDSLVEGYGGAIDPIAKIDVLKLTWKAYLPTAAVGAVSIFCFVGANSINMRRNAAIAGLYSMTRKALDEYQSKVVEQIGKSKEEKIRESVIQDKLYPIKEENIFVTGKGPVLFFDPWSSRYFYSEPEFVRRAVNEFNRRLLTDSMRSLNVFYDDLGLEGIRDGDNIGWIVETGYMEIAFTTKLTPDERPCIVLDYSRTGPRDLAWP